MTMFYGENMIKDKKILIDAYGCDEPTAVVQGVAKALNEIEDITLIVTGKKEEIEEGLKNEVFDRSRLEILDAPEVITNNDSPVSAVVGKQHSSLAVALKELKEREDAIAMISAGNTGAVLAGSMLLLGKTNGVDRPALATLFPTDKGGYTCLADCGANVDCRPDQLVLFARLAADYMHSYFGIENPKIGLLSVGTEDKKGNTQSKATFELLKNSDLNFVGNMEAKTALSGDVDVIIADGFTGNVLMKSIEGTAKSMVKRTLTLLKKYTPEGADTSFVKRAFGELAKQLDFNSMGGAVLLGVKKIVVKAHGAANADTVVNTVKQAMRMYEGGFGKE